MLWQWPCQARAVAENKRLSSNLRSGAALVNESLGIIADALRPGDRDREADPLPTAQPPINPPTATAASTALTPPAAVSGGPLPRQPSGNPQNVQAAAHVTVAQAGAAGTAAGAAVVMAAASAVASRATSSSGFDRPAGWPEEETAGFRGGLLRDMDHG